MHPQEPTPLDVEELAEAEALSGMGFWRAMPGGGTLACSPGMAMLLGTSPGSLAELARLVPALHAPLQALEEAGTPFRLAVPLGAHRVEATGKPAAHGKGLRGSLRRLQAGASSREFEDYFAGAADAIAVCDDSGRYIAANEAFCQLLMRPREEVLRLSTQDVVVALDSGHPVQDGWEKFLGTGHEAGRATLRRADGSTIDVQYHAGADVRQGEHLCVMREARLLGAAIRTAEQAEARLRLILDALPDPVFLLDPEPGEEPLRILYVNEAVTLTHGYLPEELLGRSLVTTLDDHCTAALARERLELARQGHLIAFEGAHRRKDGSVVPIEARAKMVKWGGRDVLLAVDRDRSAIHAAQSHIRRAEQRFQALFEEGASLLLEFSTEGNVTYLSANWERVTGLEAGAALGEPFTKLLHPEDVENWLDHLGNALGGLRPSRPLVYRVAATGGAWRWHSATMSVLLDEEGEVDGVVSIARDVTEHERLAEELRAERGLFAGGPLLALAWSGAIGRRVVRASSNAKAVVGHDEAELCQPGLAFSALVHPDDVPGLHEAKQACLADGDRSLQASYRLQHKALGYRWYHEFSTATRDAQGAVVGWRGYLLDVTAIRAAEQALRSTSEQMRLVLEAANDGWWDHDLASGRVYYSPRWCSMLGIENEEEIQGREDAFRDRVHPDDVDGLRQATAEALNFGAEEFEREFRMRHADGRYLVVRARALVRRDRQHAPTRVSGSILDLTELRRAEEELRLERATLQYILESVLSGYWTLDVATDQPFMSARFKQALGYRDDEVPNTWEGWARLVHPEDRARVRHAMAAHVATNGQVPYREEVRFRAKDGSTAWMLSTGQLFASDQPAARQRMVGCHVDITPRKNAQLALQDALDHARISNQLLELAGRLARLGYWEVFLDGRQTVWSPVTYAIHDLPVGAPISLSSAIDFYAEEHREMVRQQVEWTIETGEPLAFEAELVTAAGRRVWIRAHGIRSLDVAGNPISLSGAIQDIDAERRAAQDIRERERQFDAFQRHVPGVIFEARVEPGSRLTVPFMSDRGEDLWGIPRRRMARDARDWLQAIPEGDRQRVLDVIRESAANLTSFSILHRYQHPGKGERWIRTTATPSRDATGATTWYGYAADVSDQKREADERAEFERNMLHTQRLESLGLLAGGIAHDFNNMLGAILGNLENVLADRKALPGDAKEGLEHAVAICLRAADLTRQMLAYSGRGQFIIRPTNLSSLARENAGMLRASIRKNVRLELETAGDIPPILSDVGQVQQVLLNLLTNANEAIARSTAGRIWLRTYARDFDDQELAGNRAASAAAAGCYAVLEVQDNGAGMDQDTLSRLFDPFFSTKVHGRGLGMSAILGIVRGHRGAILVESEPGRGTRIRVLFPPAPETGQVLDAPAPPAGQPTEEPVLPAPPRHARHPHVPSPVVTPPPAIQEEDSSARTFVLVVDDEPSILSFCRRALEDMGYGVLTANSGDVAIEIYRDYHPMIAWVVLDLSMPGRDGIQTHDELRLIALEPRIIFSSGYGSTVLSSRPDLMDRVGFLQKPYRREDLAAILAS